MALAWWIFGAATSTTVVGELASSTVSGAILSLNLLFCSPLTHVVMTTREFNIAQRLVGAVPTRSWHLAIAYNSEICVIPQRHGYFQHLMTATLAIVDMNPRQSECECWSGRHVDSDGTQTLVSRTKLG